MNSKKIKCNFCNGIGKIYTLLMFPLYWYKTIICPACDRKKQKRNGVK